MINPQGLKPITEKDLEQFDIIPVAGRACHFYIHYCLLLDYIHGQAEWPLLIGAVGHMKDSMAKWYYLSPKNIDLDAYLNLYIKKISLLNDIEPYIKTLTDDTVRHLDNKLSTYTNQQLGELIDYYCDQFVRLAYMAVTLRFIDVSLLARLTDYLAERSDTDEVLSLLSVPKEISKSAQEELELWKLAEEIQTNKLALDSEIVTHALTNIHNNYCWLSCGYYNEKAKTVEEYKEIVTEIINNPKEHRIAEVLRRFESDHTKRDSFVKTLDEDLKTYASIASAIPYLKDLYKFSINKITYYSEPLFEEIARRTKTTSDFIKSLYPEEMIKILHGEVIEVQKIQQRNNHNIILAFDGHYQFMEGREADRFEEKYLKVDAHNQKEFKGRVASPGFAKGPVKIIRSVNDFHKMNEKDILVVLNTTPDYVPILHKAGAIVAEEGGLTAHVSVVSREFGIPCVVGVKRITEILKDGDMVEVDAEKGIVKII